MSSLQRPSKSVHFFFRRTSQDALCLVLTWLIVGNRINNETLLFDGLFRFFADVTNDNHFFRYQSCTIFKTHYPRATIRSAGLFARALLLLIILLAREWKYIIISCSAGRRRGVVYVTAEDMARRECAYASTTVRQHVRTIGTRKNHLPNGRNWQMFIRVIHFTIVAACTCVYA